MTSQKVMEFLAAIFDGRPEAFQGLTFVWNGSQQAIHKDTAYVKIDTSPMHLAATWLALEDIQPGTGEFGILCRQPSLAGLPVRRRQQMDGNAHRRARSLPCAACTQRTPSATAMCAGVSSASAATS